MTAQMTDKEIIEGLEEAIVDALDWNYLDDNADKEIGAIRAKYISLFQAAISRLQFHSALLQEVGLDIDAYLSDTIMGDKHSSVDWQKVFRKTSANLDAAFNQEEE